MLRIYDEFLEDETILALRDRTYRLHVSALLYCARNLTDGDVSDRAVKVLQALLGYPAKRHVVELVEAELWVPLADGGYRIRNYLEFNPKSGVVKAEKKKARDRMRKLREKRADTNEHLPEPSAARSPEHSPALPYQAVPGPSLDQISGRHFDRESLPETINPENELLAARLLQRIGDHADPGTAAVVAAYARQLPPAAIAKVVESLETGQPVNRAAYAVSALRDELAERRPAA